MTAGTTSASYVPEDAACPLWQRFLDRILGGNVALVEYVQRFAGYCLAGTVEEHVLPIFWGPGANGKSTLVNLLLAVLGDDYSAKASRDLFLAKKDARHPTAVAQLFGKRLAVCVESSDTSRLDEPLVKELTGGDLLRARRMREEF